jgi:hypothetical protein
MHTVHTTVVAVDIQFKRAGIGVGYVVNEMEKK